MDDVERAVLEYLSEFGDTRESDLIQFIMNELGYSRRGAQKLVRRLEEKKNEKEKIFRVVHTKLRPPAVYYSTKEYIPLEIRKELIRVQAQLSSAEALALGGH